MLQPIPPKCSRAYAALKLSGSPTAWLWHFTKSTCLSEPSAPLCSPCSTSEASRARQLKCLEWRWCYHSPNQPCTLQKASNPLQPVSRNCPCSCIYTHLLCGKVC